AVRLRRPRPRPGDRRFRVAPQTQTPRDQHRTRQRRRQRSRTARASGQERRRGEGVTMAKAQFGMIGLAVMGSNLALNVEEHGFPVAVWNREPQVVDTFVQKNAGKKFSGTKSLEDFCAALERPRR